MYKKAYPPYGTATFLIPMDVAHSAKADQSYPPGARL